MQTCISMEHYANSLVEIAGVCWLCFMTYTIIKFFSVSRQRLQFRERFDCREKEQNGNYNK